MRSDLVDAWGDDPLVQGALAAVEALAHGNTEEATDHVTHMTSEDPDGVIPALWVVWSRVIAEGRARVKNPALPLPRVPGFEAVREPARQVVTSTLNDDFDGVGEIYMSILWDGMDEAANVSIL